MILISCTERCFIKDKNLPGPNLKAKKLPNPEECQKFCQKTKECEMFIYVTKEFNDKKTDLIFNDKAQHGDCYLKDKIGNELQAANGLIAGPKFCNEDGGNIQVQHYYVLYKVMYL